MSYTDEDLVRCHQELSKSIDDLSDTHKSELLPYTTSQQAIENEMHRRLNERGAKNSATPLGTFFKKTNMSTKVVDKNVFLDHVFAERNYSLLTQAVAKEAVKDHIEKSGGHPPPGVEVAYIETIHVRKK